MHGSPVYYLPAQKVGVIGRTCQLSTPKPVSFYHRGSLGLPGTQSWGRGVLTGWCADTWKILFHFRKLIRYLSKQGSSFPAIDDKVFNVLVPL